MIKVSILNYFFLIIGHGNTQKVGIYFYCTDASMTRVCKKIKVLVCTDIHNTRNYFLWKQKKLIRIIKVIFGKIYSCSKFWGSQNQEVITFLYPKTIQQNKK